MAHAKASTILWMLLPLIISAAEASADVYRITDLGTGIIPAEINSNGDVTGTVVSPFSSPVTFLRSNGVVTKLGLLGGTGSWGARAIDETSQGAGRSQERKGWPIFGMARDTGNLGFVPTAINNSGIMVGCAADNTALLRKAGPLPKWAVGKLAGTNLDTRCVPATFAEGKATVLADQLAVGGDDWILEGVFDLNDKGEIVGYGTKNSQRLHGFILSPSR